MNRNGLSKELYDACYRNHWEGVIGLSKYKDSANSKAPYRDKHDRTCLHIAVTKKAPCGVVRAILDAHKECPVCIAGLSDDDQRTALHVAAEGFVCSHDEAAVLKMLIDHNPHCATTRDYGGYTPLQRILAVCSCESSNERDIMVACVRALLNASTTESILLPSHLYKCTALHSACSYSNVSPEVVKMILERCPRAVLAKNARGETPLHSVARQDDNHDCNFAKITLLLKSLARQTQSGAAAVDDNGQTPLHFAIYCADKRSIKLLIDSQPQSVCVKDKDGMTPLGCVQTLYAITVRAQRRKQGMTVRFNSAFRLLFKDMCDKCNWLVEAMLCVRHGRECITGENSLWMNIEQKNAANKKCLEHVLIHNYLRLGSECPLDFFLVLMELHPRQIQMKDTRGDLPLHIALENGVQHAKPRSSSDGNTFGMNGSDAIKELMSAYPPAARVPNRNGELPFHILLQNRNGEIGWNCSVHPLLRAHPAALWYERTNLLHVLLPLILAKLGDENDLSALYEIVREMPPLCLGVTETTTLVLLHTRNLQALCIK